MDHNYIVKINYDPGLCNIRGAGWMITATAAPCRDCVRSRAINVIPIMVIRGAKCTQRICYQAGEEHDIPKPRKKQLHTGMFFAYSNYLMCYQA